MSQLGASLEATLLVQLYSHLSEDKKTRRKEECEMSNLI